MSNMVTWLLPLNNGRSFSSALMARRFLESCRPFRLMYAQSFLMTSVRGMRAVADDRAERRARAASAS